MHVGHALHDNTVYLYRLSRQTGVRQEDELETSDGLFDYVTEDEYSKIIKDRQADQWIMDDGKI